MNERATERRLERLTGRFFLFSLALFAACKAWISYTRYLNQDEFETLHQGWLVFSGAVQYLDFNSNHPPLAFELVGLLNHVTSNAITQIYGARTLTFMSACITLWLVYRIAHSVYGPMAARWAVIFYGFNAMFWEWSSEVRTDFLMVPLWLWAVTLLLRPNPRSIPRQMIDVGLLMGVAFWTNQKVVFHAVPIGLFMLAGGPNGRWRLKHVALAASASLLPTLLMVGAFAWRDALSAMLQHNFIDAWTLARQAPYGTNRLFTVLSGVVRDPGFVFFAVQSVFLARQERGNPSHWFIVGGAVWMLASFFLTPGPFPYYLLHVYPLFAVAIGGRMARAIPRLASWLTEAPGSRGARLAVLAMTLAAFPLVRMAKLLEPTNPYQLEVLSVAEALIPPGTAVFDGSGALFTHPDAYPFRWILWNRQLAALNNGEFPPLEPTLRDNECRMVIDNYRTLALREDLRAMIERSFVRVWGPLRLPGYDSVDPVEVTEWEIELWYGGRYEASHPELLVDGEPMGTERALEAGLHTLELPGGGERVWLRPVHGLDLPPDDTDPMTFPGSYGYGY